MRPCVIKSFQRTDHRTGAMIPSHTTLQRLLHTAVGDVTPPSQAWTNSLSDFEPACFGTGKWVVSRRTTVWLLIGAWWSDPSSMRRLDTSFVGFWYESGRGARIQAKFSGSTWFSSVFLCNATQEHSEPASHSNRRQARRPSRPNTRHTHPPTLRQKPNYRH